MTFIMFFPQLVMGPIVHFRELVAQFKRPDFARARADNLVLGLCIFIMGLAKKLLIADSLAPFVNSAFSVASEGLSLIDAWAAIIGFSLQVYFDFSAYSDMAIGLARMFNINLPINFDSPYRAVDRFDFWRRWHISFSTFMRRYLFFPLCRNRYFRLSPISALLVTVFVSGLWHGFGVTFVIWGLLQGVLMLSVHLRRRLFRQHPFLRRYLSVQAVWLRIVFMFLAGSLIGVFFRAPDLATAGTMFLSLMGAYGVDLPLQLLYLFPDLGLESAAGFRNLIVNRDTMYVMGAAAIIIWGLPSSKVFFGRYWTATDQRSSPPKFTPGGPSQALNRLRFGFSVRWGVAFGALAFLCVMNLDQASRFIYYQF